MRKLATVAFACALLGMAAAGLAGQRKLSLNAIVAETQKMSEKANEVSLVWWLPEEFWRASMAEDPTATAAQVEEVLKVIRPYTLIAAVDGTMGAFGGVTYKPEAEMRAGILLKDAQGTTHRPYAQDKISADAKNLIAIMKPIIAGIVGPMGENMHFFMFPATERTGKPIASATAKGGFSVVLGGKEYRWRLPLGSVLPPKTCAKCAETLSGAYNFCPWCGTKLPAPQP